MDAADQRFMAQALSLARRGCYTTDPNPRVGCVIVRDDIVLGSGWHQQAGGPHAEIHALQQARESNNELLCGATAYITLEPCCHQGRTGPCTEALIAAGIRRVVVAIPDPNPQVAGQGLERLRQAGITVLEGVGRSEAEQLNAGFIARMTRGRPLLRCKLAMSVDGRTAMASGESQWITSAAARQDVQRLRARSSAIMTGIGSVLADDPALTLRRDELGEELAAAAALPGDGGLRQPLRIVIDTHARLPLTSRLLQTSGPVLLATAAASAAASVAPQLSLLTLPLDSEQQCLDLTALMQALAAYELNDILLEAGATLSGAMLNAGLIDELIIYMAPKLMGNNARGLFDLPGLSNMAQCVEIDISDIRAIGRDWRITARIASRA
jgi:diaminohydroxyphosphoribosylaminopyrimidine deaminase/5-amino-6-(5-phosphoribosylamino)uracil reductase